MFACLYVVGLVAINLYLLGLGIADFTLLQARCIATGALCCVYLTMLLVIAWGLSLMVSSALAASTGLRMAGRLLLSAVLTVLAFLIAAGSFAQLTPYAVDQPIVDLRSARKRWADLRTQLQMAQMFFLNRETFSLLFVLLTGFVMLRTLHLQEPAQLKSRNLRWIAGVLGRLQLHYQAGAYLAVALVALGALASLLLVLLPFARNVYPNVLVSYGGGQPRVVEIQPHTTGTAPEAAYVGIRLIRQAGMPVVTEQLVLWHESDKFLYVAPLRLAPARPDIVAIDQRSVRSMRQLDVPLRVGSEGRVLVIYP